MFDKIHLTLNFKFKVSHEVVKREMNVKLTSTSFSKCQLKVTCLVVRVISISCQVLNRVCQLMCIFLGQTYTLEGWLNEGS